MGKSKSKSRKEAEHLRGIIRSLKKQLKQQNNDADEPTETEDTKDCTNCGKGTLEVKDFVHIKMLVCNTCDYREKLDAEEKP